MIKKRLHITLFLLWVWSFCFSQQYTNYTTKEGLPSNHIYTILQDAKGFIWFLTDKGMVQYNGTSFKTFTTKNGLPNNDVWEAFTTPDGKVWYFSKATKIGYVANDTVVSFSNKNKHQIMSPIFSSHIKNKVYPAEPNISYLLKDSLWHPIPINNKFNKKEFDGINKIHHKEVGYFAFSKKTETINLYNNTYKKITEIKNTDIYGKKGARGQITDSLFFFTTNKAYAILNLNTKKLHQFYFKDAIGKETVLHPRINLANNKIQITGSGFVAYLDSNYKIKNPFYFPKHITSHFGFIDKNNTIWLATFNNGVYKLPYTKKPIQYLFENKKIQSFNNNNGNLTIGVYKKGFYQYNPKDKTTKHLIKNKLHAFSANYIKELESTFYSGQNKLVIQKKNTQHLIDFKHQKKYPFKENELGRKWVYFNNYLYSNFSFGIHKIDPKTLTIKKEYTLKGCNDLLVFNNRLLVASTNGLKEVKNDSLTNIIFKEKNIQSSILSLTKLANNKLLVNTDGFGSYITDLQTIKQVPHTKYLIVNNAFVANKTLWLATNNGLLKLLFDDKTTTYQYGYNYTVSDGLPLNQVNFVSVHNQNIIVGGNNGVAILPKKQQQQAKIINIYFKKSTYNNRSLTNNTSYLFTKNNTVNFTIATIDFSEKINNKTFKYKLLPLQREWQKSTSTTINYNNLSPNTYRFIIEKDGIEKTIPFTIKPLWWQTWIFKSIAGFLTVFSALFGVWLLSKQVQKKKNAKILQQKELSEIQLKALRSQMNPHFVFNALAAIQYYINKNNFKASEKYLVKFSKLIRQFFELSKENEITLNEEIELLQRYLAIEKLRFREKLNFTIQYDKELNLTLTKIPTMLLQPVVENAVNHGIFNKIENGKVTVYFKYISKNCFLVTVYDDGVGFANTTLKTNKYHSSDVLKDRIRFLNQTKKWNINITHTPLYPNLTNKGNKTTFTITKLN